MSQKMYTGVSGVVFGFVCALHVLRVIFAWEAVIGGWTVPLWFSFIGIAISGYLVYSAYKLLS